MTMSSRERVMTALRRAEPDRVPFCEFFVDRAMAQKLVGLEEDKNEHDGTILKNPYTVEESKAIASFLGLDNINYILAAPEYAHFKKGADGRSFPTEGMIKSEADLSMIELPDPHNDRLYDEAEKFVKHKGEYFLCFQTRIGLTQPILSLGTENFCFALYDNRTLVEKLLDIYFDWMVEVADRICQMGFDAFWTTDDFAFKTGLLFSPALFKDLLVPRYRRVLEKVTIPWILHSDGNITESMEMLLDLGVSAIHPNEPEAMDIRAMKKTYGDRICLMGNVDMNLLAGGKPDEVDKEVRELIRDIGPGGGYILTSGNSMASFLNAECVLALAKAARKYGRYPIELS